MAREPKLSLIPLGGLGEIGKNMMAVRFGENILVIDSGLMFPEEDMLGIDIVIPDITFLLENKSQVCGICLTHGHEDHIGALPYVLKQLNVPVYGTKLTLGLLQGKLKEHGVEAVLKTVRPRDTLN
ncbi:MAG TPA: ribonuclease J, partial [Spirochaetia bacterium]|nr:ribonuclease J [Spirochaetia bacterium]